MKTTHPKRNRIDVWEAMDPTDAFVAAAGDLYERTLEANERIPWEWIERSVLARTSWKPGGWSRHLLLATVQGQAQNPDALAGFAFASFLPGYGGYVNYLGVDERYRGQGVGGRLLSQCHRVLATSAGAVDEPLPFIVWESHPPEAGASASVKANWQARLKVFHRAGGMRVRGLPFWAANTTDETATPVALNLFVKPVDQPVKAFDEERLIEIAMGLYSRVYGVPANHRYCRRTRARAWHPRLEPCFGEAAVHRFGDLLPV